MREMIDIKGLGGIKGADKTKAKSKTGSVSGSSFADMLEEAQAADASEAMAPVAGNLPVTGGFVPLEEDLPKDAQGQARELLKTLKGLAEDALSGSPTAAVDRLEQLAGSFDENALSAEQKKVLDEVRTRAAVEVAKLKG